MKLINTEKFAFVLVWKHNRDGESNEEVHVYDTIKAALQGKSEIVDDINESDDGYFNKFKNNCFDNWKTADNEGGFYILDENAKENSDFISIKKIPIETLIKMV